MVASKRQAKSKYEQIYNHVNIIFKWGSCSEWLLPFLIYTGSISLLIALWWVSFVFQPPPKIPDKQLDEREHTIEEWKGKKGIWSIISLLGVCWTPVIIVIKVLLSNLIVFTLSAWMSGEQTTASQPLSCCDTSFSCKGDEPLKWTKDLLVSVTFCSP